MTTFRIAPLKESGKGRKGKAASHAATAADIRAAIASSFITEQEARGLALCALMRSRQWQRPSDPSDKRLHRTAKEAEMADGVTVLPDENPDAEVAGA